MWAVWRLKIIMTPLNYIIANGSVAFVWVLVLVVIVACVLVLNRPSPEGDISETFEHPNMDNLSGLKRAALNKGYANLTKSIIQMNAWASRYQPDMPFEKRFEIFSNEKPNRYKTLLTPLRNEIAWPLSVGVSIEAVKKAIVTITNEFKISDDLMLRILQGVLDTFQDSKANSASTIEADEQTEPSDIEASLDKLKDELTYKCSTASKVDMLKDDIIKLSKITKATSLDLKDEKAMDDFFSQHEIQTLIASIGAYGMMMVNAGESWEYVGQVCAQASTEAKADDLCGLVVFTSMEMAMRNTESMNNPK